MGDNTCRQQGGWITLSAPRLLDAPPADHAFALLLGVLTVVLDADRAPRHRLAIHQGFSPCAGWATRNVRRLPRTVRNPADGKDLAAIAPNVQQVGQRWITRQQQDAFGEREAHGPVVEQPRRGSGRRRGGVNPFSADPRYDRLDGSLRRCQLVESGHLNSRMIVNPVTTGGRRVWARAGTTGPAFRAANGHCGNCAPAGNHSLTV